MTITEVSEKDEATGEEAKWLMEGDEFLLGGIEVHARIVQKDNKPGVDFTYEPIVCDLEIPAEVVEFSQLMEKMCRQTVENFPDPLRRGRFYREVKKDGARNRCWYRITVTSRFGADEQIKERISDTIDPAFIRADPHVKFRAKQLRAMLMRCLKEEPVI